MKPDELKELEARVREAQGLQADINRLRRSIEDVGKARVVTLDFTSEGLRVLTQTETTDRQLPIPAGNLVAAYADDIRLSLEEILIKALNEHEARFNAV